MGDKDGNSDCLVITAGCRAQEREGLGMGDANVAMKASQAVFSEDKVAYLGGIMTYKGEMVPYANGTR